MPVRSRVRIEVGISSTTQEARDLGNGNFEQVTDGLGEGGSRKFTLAASTTDAPLDLGNISSAAMLVIRTNAKDPLQDPVEISIKRNDIANEAHPITPLPDTKEGFYVTTTSGVTSLFATNAGSVDMELTLFTAGD